MDALCGLGWGWGEMDAPVGRTPEAQPGKSNMRWDKFPMQLLRDILGLETLSGKMSKKSLSSPGNRGLSGEDC